MSGDTNEATTREVTLIGPCSFTAQVTDEELEAVENAEFPIGELPEPTEWMPVGTPDDWEIHTDADDEVGR